MPQYNYTLNDFKTFDVRSCKKTEIERKQLNALTLKGVVYVQIVPCAIAAAASAIFQKLPQILLPPVPIAIAAVAIVGELSCML